MMRIVLLVATLVSASGFSISNPLLGSNFVSFKCIKASRLNAHSVQMSARDLPDGELRTQLIGAKKAVAELIDKTNANPLLVADLLFCKNVKFS